MKKLQEKVTCKESVVSWIWALQKVWKFCKKVAPLGDPVEVTVRGYELSLRKADAEMIQVE